MPSVQLWRQASNVLASVCMSTRLDALLKCLMLARKLHDAGGCSVDDQLDAWHLKTINAALVAMV